uniref:Si:ch73-250a16.5 n=1 Tax=Electrophorus electricus TaxID=8005 RepID=A0A4W4E2X6_ELEEL
MTGMSSKSKDLLREQEVLHAPETTRWTICNSACVSVLFLLVLGVLAARPIHAQCSAIWTINISCLDVSSLLVNQIKQWKTESCPPRNRKCMYSLVAVSDAGIVAMHTTAIMRFVDDITFNFSSPNSDSCEIKGLSASRSWYAILDSGANYLNMYNLMKGSGLSSSPSFTESINDHECNLYSSTRQNLEP